MYVSLDFSNVLCKLLHPSHEAEIHSKMIIGECLSPPESNKKFLVDNRSIEIEYKVYPGDFSPRARVLMLSFSANSNSEYEFNRSDIRQSIAGSDTAETMTLKQALYRSKVSYAYGDFIEHLVAVASKSTHSTTVVLQENELHVFVADGSNAQYEVISFDLNLK